jgi:mono/diheme cytochrome c family protein
LLAGICSVGVAACGGSSDNNTTTAAPAASSETAPATSAASTEAATTQAATSEAGTTATAAGDPAAGKAVFTANCASCHTLADAGSKGAVGPNLDDLKPDEARVKHQVEVGGAIMPAFKGTLSDADIANVAAYVASVAGK